MRTFLLQPYPFGVGIGRKLRVCAGVGLFITLFLLLFRPFGLHELPAGQQVQHALLFGLVSFGISALLQIGLPLLFPHVFAESNWKSWKEILLLLLIVLCISAGNYALMYYLYPPTNYYRSFGQVVWMTFQVGIFPVVAIVFMKQMLLYRKYAEAAIQVNESLAAQTPLPAAPLTDPDSRKLVLTGEGQKDQLELATHQLLFVASSDNYVRVVFVQNAKERSRLLRASLKNMEQQLASCPALFRCHRMYLVNLDQVVQVSGNAQGLRLHLQGVAETIPVSRSLTQTVRERLAHLSHSPQKA